MESWVTNPIKPLRDFRDSSWCLSVNFYAALRLHQNRVNKLAMVLLPLPLCPTRATVLLWVFLRRNPSRTQSLIFEGNVFDLDFTIKTFFSKAFSGLWFWGSVSNISKTLSAAAFPFHSIASLTNGLGRGQNIVCQPHIRDKRTAVQWGIGQYHLPPYHNRMAITTIPKIHL